MLQNHFRLALRVLLRDRTISLLNIFGLTAAFASVLVIFFFVQNELRHDRFFREGERIFRITFDETYGRPDGRHLATTSPPMAGALKADYPEIEHALRLRYTDEVVIEYGEQRFYESNLVYADSTFFNLFSFPLRSGEAAKALTQPNTVVLTPAMAEKYFGEEDPMGKTLVLEQEVPLQVTGVLQDDPKDTHLQFDFLVSFVTFRVPPGYPVTMESWDWISFHTYLLLREGQDPEALEAKLPEFFADHYSPERAERVRLHLQPLRDIYFHSASLMNIHDNKSGSLLYVYGLGAVGFLILLVACFNFMNITTARSVRRGREVGLRKVLGATAPQLVRQYLGEALILSLISFFIGLLIFELLKDQLSAFLGWPLQVKLSNYLWLGPLFLLLAILVGLGAGLYPAVVLSRLPAVRMLRGRFQNTPEGQQVRSVLVAVQFVITTVLLVGSLTIFRQMEFIRQRDLGFDQEQVVALQLRASDFLQRFDRARSVLARNPHVAMISAGDVFDGNYGSIPISPLGPESDDPLPMHILGAYYDYIPTTGIELVAGRGFSRDFPRDTTTGILVNEAAVRAFGWSDPLGKQLRVGDIKEGEVVGVVKNFHYNSLHEPVKPMVIIVPETTMSYLILRLRPGTTGDILASLRENWAEIAPELPFQLTFLDEKVNRRYEADQRFSRLILFFTVITVIIGTIGLYALVSVMVRYRTREIGIRKVLGATVSTLTFMLSWQFLRLVVVANVVALPFAWWGARRWLEQFAYQASMSWVLFAAAFTVSLLLAFLSVGGQTMRAARANPGKVLRSE